MSNDNMDAMGSEPTRSTGKRKGLTIGLAGGLLAGTAAGLVFGVPGLSNAGTDSNSVTPAAVVQSATTRRQKVVSGSLETLPHVARAADMKAPALIVIGEVVKLRRQLAWFAPESEATPAVRAAV